MQFYEELPLEAGREGTKSVNMLNLNFPWQTGPLPEVHLLDNVHLVNHFPIVWAFLRVTTVLTRQTLRICFEVQLGIHTTPNTNSSVWERKCAAVWRNVSVSRGTRKTHDRVAPFWSGSILITDVTFVGHRQGHNLSLQQFLKL